MRRHHLEDDGKPDLTVGTRYVPKTSNLSHEPIQNLLSCGNMGGFRIAGSPTNGKLELVALYTTFSVGDWPDRIDRRSARLTYYGDNREPGRELHDTPHRGNLALRLAFEWTHLGPDTRSKVPPFFVFSATDEGRAVDFHGVVAPGAPNVSEQDDLVARWRTKHKERFQNYEATFTFLDIPSTPRSWIDDALRGNAMNSAACPDAWTQWVQDRTYLTLAMEA